MRRMARNSHSFLSLNDRDNSTLSVICDSRGLHGIALRKIVIPPHILEVGEMHTVDCQIINMQ